MTTKLHTAQQFFLPQFDGDEGAFQPYKLGECVPDKAGMGDFIDVTLHAAQDHYQGKGGKTLAVRTAIRAVGNDAEYAQALRKWCLAQATNAYRVFLQD